MSLYCQLNTKAFERLKAMCRAGDYTADSWAFTAEDSNDMLGTDMNWTEYGMWFLGVDHTQNKESKAAYDYPIGKQGKVNVNALKAIAKVTASGGEYPNPAINQAVEEVLNYVNQRDTEAMEASAELSGKSISFEGVCKIKAAAAGDKESLPMFDIFAYDGGKMNLNGWDDPVVVDLAGLEGTDQSLPFLRDHDMSKPMGHSEKIVNDGKSLSAYGPASVDAPYVKEVVDSGKRKFPWKASIGASPLRNEYVPPGRAAEANGQTFVGPVNMVRGSRLNEISVLVKGANAGAKTRIAAKAAEGNDSMDPKFKAWLEAKGFEAVEKMTEKQLKPLEAMCKKEQEIEAKAAKDKAELEAKPKTDGDPIAAMEAKMRETASAIIVRNNEIQKVAAKFPEIAAQAINENWSMDKLNLEVLRKDRGPEGTPDNPREAFLVGNKLAGITAEMTYQAICAAGAMTGGVSEKYAFQDTHGVKYDDRVKTLATSTQFRRWSIHQIAARVAEMRGQHFRSGPLSEPDLKEILNHPNERLIQAAGDGAGWSTMSLSGITENILNKAMLEAYGQAETTYPEWCYLTDTNDFKVFKRYRLTASGNLAPVGPSGDLQAISLQDESYQNQLTTTGAILTITRNIIINDDMGALTQAPTDLGLEAAAQIEQDATNTLLGLPNLVATGNSVNQAAPAFNFFSAGAKNYQSGTGSVLSITSLSTAVQQFRQMKNANGRFITFRPTKLLVPPALETTALNLFNGAMLTVQGLQLPASGAQVATQVPNVQRFEKQFKPIINPYLSSVSSTTNAGSDTGWYLLPEPAGGKAVVQMAFLRGQRAPIIERGEMPLNTLGIAMRVYFDYSPAAFDWRCGQFSAGA